MRSIFALLLVSSASAAVSLRGARALAVLPPEKLAVIQENDEISTAPISPASADGVRRLATTTDLSTCSINATQPTFTNIGLGDAGSMTSTNFFLYSNFVMRDGPCPVATTRYNVGSDLRYYRAYYAIKLARPVKRASVSIWTSGTVPEYEDEIGKTIDTTLFVGTGCPSSEASFNCKAQDDDFFGRADLSKINDGSVPVAGPLSITFPTCSDALYVAVSQFGRMPTMEEAASTIVNWDVSYTAADWCCIPTPRLIVVNALRCAGFVTLALEPPAISQTITGPTAFAPPADVILPKPTGYTPRPLRLGLPLVITEPLHVGVVVTCASGSNPPQVMTGMRTLPASASSTVYSNYYVDLSPDFLYPAGSTTCSLQATFTPTTLDPVGFKWGYAGAGGVNAVTWELSADPL